MEEEIGGGRVGREAAGRAGEGGGFQFVHGGAEFLVREQGAELGVVGGDVAAEGEELLARGHVDAGGDGDIFGADVEVEAGAGGFRGPRGPPGGDVGLVRALVGGETRVAVDAHHGLVRRADVVGREVFEGVVDLFDEGEHGSFELALVDGLARIEPEAVVMAGERAEEFEGFGSEVGGHKAVVSC